MAFAASLSSSCAAGPLYAISLPPTFTNGNASSHSTFSLATARAVTMSNFSRISPFAASSALACTASMFTPARFAASFRKLTRFPSESTSVTCTSGLAIASGIPGKPAPLPKSIMPRPAGIISNFSGISESTKCRLTASSSDSTRVRFMLSFTSFRYVQYLSMLSAIPSLISTPHSRAALISISFI